MMNSGLIDEGKQNTKRNKNQDKLNDDNETFG